MTVSSFASFGSEGHSNDPRSTWGLLFEALGLLGPRHETQHNQTLNPQLLGKTPLNRCYCDPGLFLLNSRNSHVTHRGKNRYSSLMKVISFLCQLLCWWVFNGEKTLVSADFVPTTFWQSGILISWVTSLRFFSLLTTCSPSIGPSLVASAAGKHFAVADKQLMQEHSQGLYIQRCMYIARLH